MRPEPTAAVYNTTQVCRLTGLGVRRLQSWVTQGFITPEVVQVGPRRCIYRWTFRDVLALRAAAAARLAGASMQALRRAVAYLGTLPESGSGHVLSRTVLALDGRGEIFKVLPGERQALALVRRRGQGLWLSVDPLRRELMANARAELKNNPARPAHRPKGFRPKDVITPATEVEAAAG